LPRWERWYQDFAYSFATINGMYLGGIRRAPFPSWHQVQSAMPGIFENTKLKVINGEKIDDSLNFMPIVDSAGVRQRPEDCYTIVVGGNVLSRGLTIEGLCITYFTRWAKQPVDDTKGRSRHLASRPTVGL